MGTGKRHSQVVHLWLIYSPVLEKEMWPEWTACDNCRMLVAWPRDGGQSPLGMTAVLPDLGTHNRADAASISFTIISVLGT